MSKASDLAYQRIRAEITAGKWVPGTPLREEELASFCGVSRTPVREALRRLETELLVRRSEGARTFVADWSTDDISEMFVLRALLEGHAAERAATRISGEQLNRLRKLNDLVLQASHNSDTETFLAANRDFHTIVIEASHSPRIAAMLSSLVEQPVVLRTAQRYDSNKYQRSYVEHAALLDAFEARDPIWARNTMMAHIQRAQHVFMKANSDS